MKIRALFAPTFRVSLISVPVIEKLGFMTIIYNGKVSILKDGVVYGVAERDENDLYIFRHFRNPLVSLDKTDPMMLDLSKRDRKRTFYRDSALHNSCISLIVREDAQQINPVYAFAASLESLSSNNQSNQPLGIKKKRNIADFSIPGPGPGERDILTPLPSTRPGSRHYCLS